LSQLEAMKEPQSAEPLALQVEDEGEMELPKLDLPAFVENEEEENYDYICFISDYKLTSDVASKLDKFLNIRNFTDASFKNRSLQYLKETNIHYIWVNLHEVGAREWIRRNINSPSGYKLVATYNVKGSAWTQDLEEYVDITVSKKHISDISYLTLGEMLAEIRAKAIKIHAPMSGCLDKLFFKSRLVQDKKN
jgi:hypothetical protein